MLPFKKKGYIVTYMIFGPMNVVSIDNVNKNVEFILFEIVVTRNSKLILGGSFICSFCFDNLKTKHQRQRIM
jgi:hypothetical protein